MIAVSKLLPQVSAATDKMLVEVFVIVYQTLDDWSVQVLCGSFSSSVAAAVSTVLVNGVGAPCLIDPAVYYGHREMDLAMTTLFGQFDASFYSAYNEAWPLQPGYEERFEIYNLYPLLVHLKLFGSSYIAQIQSTLDAFA